MTVTTSEWWEINNPSLNATYYVLNTYAFNIATLTGRLGIPPLRGENFQIDGKDGEFFVPKKVAPRTVSLGMWVVGSDENGDVDPDKVALFNENYIFLARLFHSPAQELNLRRRLTRLIGGTPTVVTYHGKGQVTGGIAPEMTGRTRAVMVVDILMSDPWWYRQPDNVPEIF